MRKHTHARSFTHQNTHPQTHTRINCLQLPSSGSFRSLGNVTAALLNMRRSIGPETSVPVPRTSVGPVGARKSNTMVDMLTKVRSLAQSSVLFPLCARCLCHVHTRACICVCCQFTGPPTHAFSQIGASTSTAAPRSTPDFYKQPSSRATFSGIDTHSLPAALRPIGACPTIVVCILYCAVCLLVACMCVCMCECLFKHWLFPPLQRQ